MKLSKSHRKRCRKLVREFFDSGRVRVHEIKYEKDFGDGWRIFQQLHKARWGRRRTPDGVFTSRRFREFHQSVARKFLQRKQLRLVWLECDGKPIAAEYQLIDQNTIYSYQSGMDPTMRNLQPGNLSLMACVRYAIANGLKTIDLLRGDEEYKEHWRAEASPCHTVNVWPKRTIGHIEYWIWCMFEFVVRPLRNRA